MMMPGARNGYPDQDYPWWIVTFGYGDWHRYAFPNYHMLLSALTLGYTDPLGEQVMAHGVIKGSNTIHVPSAEGFML